VQQFAAGLTGSAIDAPVLFQDERLTSREAEAQLAVREPDWRARKKSIDAVAAAIILQDYLDGRARQSGPPVLDASS
jgi:putative Holliday junction resolvase